MKTYDLSKSSDDSGYVICPHCAAKNPRKAYGCLSCYKVLSPSEKSGFFRANIHPAISFVTILTALVLSAMYLGNRWLATIEANMSLTLRTSSYDLEMTAEKRKDKELKKDISLEKNPSQ